MQTSYKLKIESLRPYILSLLFGTIFLLGCQPRTQLSSHFPNQLKSGESAAVQLEKTDPDQVEGNPLFLVEITTTDAITGQPIPADTFLHQKMRTDPNTSIKQFNVLPTIPCEEAHQCNLTLTPTQPDWVWVIQTRAQGYEDHIIELNFNTHSSRTFTMPIQLQPQSDQS